METKYSNLESVARNNRKQMWRDRVVAALFAVGMVVNVAVLESNARHAMTPHTSVEQVVAAVDAALANLPV